MRGIAYAGAMSNPSVNTSTAATSQSTRRARGTEAGRRLSPAPVATHRPAAPSVSGEAFPAVIVPLPLFLSKAGCSLARRSRLVSARGNPSPGMPSTGTIRSAEKPVYVARGAGEHGGTRGGGLIQARLDLHLARDVRVAEVGNHRSPDDEVRLRGGLRSGHRPDDRQRELDRIEARKRAVHAGERRAQAGGDPDG